MFDNLRQQYGQPDQPQEEMQAAESAPAMPSGVSSARTQLSAPPFLQGIMAMSPTQRFVLALMLFLNVTVLGCFALLAFERVALPF